MASVSFCDAGGLGILVEASNDLRALGGRLSVRSASAYQRKLFSLTGLYYVLQVEGPEPGRELLIADLVAAARLPVTRGVLDAALKLVVVMAHAVMESADGVSITLPRDGRLRTVAASNDVVLQMDHDQYDTGQGPCLDAAHHGQSFTSRSLDTERRWSEFVPRARARGIASIMSIPLMQASTPLGALNVYSRAPDALAAHEHDWAVQFAAEASNVLIAAVTTATADTVTTDISDALEARETIALAQGILMARRHLRPDAAHRHLIDISRRTSKTVLAVSQRIIEQPVGDSTDATPMRDRMGGSA